MNIYNENCSPEDIFDNFIEILIEQKNIAIKTSIDNAEITTISIIKNLSDFISTIDYSSLSIDNENTIMELKYILVALSDEIFLNLEWPGKDFWKFNLMENKFFKTQSAGESIFQRIDTILSRNNFLSINSAKIYLKLLALGFQGKYRDSQFHQKLSEYKKKLYIFLTHRNDFTTDKSLLFPDGYKFVITGTPMTPRENNNCTSYIFFIFIIVFCMCSGILWQQEYVKLNKIIEVLNSINGDKNV